MVEPTKPPRLLAGNPDRWSLEGFRVVVTGSTKGIGHSIATELLSLGAHVLITARDAESVDRVTADFIETYGAGAAHGVACDVANAEGRQILVDRVSSLWNGELDGLVNNVGANKRNPIQDITDEDYNLMVTTNLDGCWFLCKLLKPMLQKSSRASVVNVGSVAGVLSTGTGSVYAMTKAAMGQLSRSLGCEWGPLGIRVNCVCPWMTMTPMLEEAVKTNPTQLDAAKQATPLRRIGEPEDTAGLTAFLLMPAAAFITGQVICADGGLCSQGFCGPCVQEP
jgi:Tropinone reductase 1